VARVRLEGVGVVDAALASGKVLAEEVGFGGDAGHADDLVAEAALTVARDALGFPARVAGPGPQGPEGVGPDGRGRVVAGVGGLAGLGGAVLGEGRGRRRVARARVALQPVWKSKFYGAFVLNRRVVLHAIDATPARWRGDAGSSPLDRARTAASSPRNDLVNTRRTGCFPHRWLRGGYFPGRQARL
jgi:hypothetical protein